MGGGNGLDDRIEERPQILAAASDIGARRADFRVRIENRKIELVFLGVEIDEEIVDLVQHFLRTRVGAIDLINDDDRRQLRF